MNRKKSERAKKRKERKRIEKENAQKREGRADHEPLKPSKEPTVTKKPTSKPILSARPHPLTIIIALIGIVLTVIGLYWAIAQPDLRYIPNAGLETLTVLERKLDGEGNFVYSVQISPKFANLSWKPGFVDKVEFVPQSIVTLPEIKITSIDRERIFWHQEKPIEIRFLMTIPSDAAKNLNTKRELAVDQSLDVLDNTGKKVDHDQNGANGRLRFNFKEIVDIQIKK